MDIKRTVKQIENFCDKNEISYEDEFASTTNSVYIRIIPSDDEKEEAFTIRISDHGQVYGNPRFDLSDSPDSNTYAEVKKELVRIAKSEREYKRKERAELLKEDEETHPEHWHVSLDVPVHNITRHVESSVYLTSSEDNSVDIKLRDTEITPPLALDVSIEEAARLASIVVAAWAVSRPFAAHYYGRITDQAQYDFKILLDNAQAVINK